MSHSVVDATIAKYIEAVEHLRQGDYEVDLPEACGAGHLDRLAEALHRLARTLRARAHWEQKLAELTTLINSGLLLDDILEIVYLNFQDVIPYNRIGFALIEDDGRTVRAYWNKSDRSEMRLLNGYTAPLKGSSLETIIKTRQPRIINNLEAYLAARPNSLSSRLIVQEGLRSSLTCPLIAGGVPVGFIFFSSIEPDTYTAEHVDILKRIAGQLAVTLEKGRLTSELAGQKQAIEEQNLELRRLNELKNDFIGIAAHDLRNPISNIRVAATLLLESARNLSVNERAALLRDIDLQATHMLDLLNELLDYTQIETGKLQLKLEYFDLGRFVAEATERQALIAAPKGTRVYLQAAPSGVVQADPDRLRQVVDNLISNAIKYSPPGSTVTVGVSRLDSGWRVNVQDEGPGITPEDRQHLFKDFARLSAQPTGGEKSTGLGLAISRRVVEAHGGEIGVDSTPGRGANFWFTLPDADA